MADDSLNVQHDELVPEPGQEPETAAPRRRAAHFAAPAGDASDGASEAFTPSPRQPIGSTDDLEEVAAAYVSASPQEVSSALSEAPEPAVPVQEPAPSFADDEVPVFSAEPSPFVPNPSAPPLQGAVPLVTPPVEFSDSPGDTIPHSFDELPARINSEGPALYTQDVFTVPDAPAEPQRDALGASGPFEPVQINTATSQETGAPRPIGVDPSSTGAFHTLSAGEGAVLTTRDTASSAKDAALTNLSESDRHRRSGSLREATSHQVASSQNARARRSSQPNKKLVVAILAIALLLGAAGFFFVTNVLQKSGGQAPRSGNQATAQVVGVGDGVSFGGYEYKLLQGQEGLWTITRAQEGSSASSPVATLPGAPVALVLHNGALYVPENLEGTWDVVALMIADGSELTQLQMGDGTLFGGQGSIASAVMNGDVLTITDANGQAFTFNLAV